MATTAPTAPKVLAKGETYIGAGNQVSYFEGATPVHRMVVSSGSIDSDFVEVVFYLNPNNNERTTFPTAVSLRTFELVKKVDIFAVNGEPVVIK